MKNENSNNTIKQEIPIFFATDNNYIPYLDVALRSLITNASKDFKYIINMVNYIMYFYVLNPIY